MLEREHRHERVRLHPGELAGAKRRAQLRAELARALEPQERLRLARRHPEPLARERGQSRKAAPAIRPRAGHLEQQRCHLGEQPLLDLQRAAQPRVELDRVDRVEVLDERREEGRQVRKRVGCAPVCTRRACGARRDALASLALLALRAPVCARGKCSGVARPGSRSAPSADSTSAAITSAACACDSASPATWRASSRARPQRARTRGETRSHTVVRGPSSAPSSSVSAIPAASSDRASTAPHLARERARGQALREIQPGFLVLRRGHPAHQARLRPGQIPRDERGIDARQPAQRTIDVREVLDLARREAQSFDRIVARPHVAEPIPRLRRDELPASAASTRRTGAPERASSLEADHRIGRIQRPHQRESFHTILVGTERVRATEREDRGRV